MTRASSILLGVIATALVGACTSGNPSGGDPRFDAGPITTSGGPALCHPSGKTLGTGHTWAELYGDYFGTTGAANCGGANPASCHGQADGKGAISSGFVCPPNRDGCYMGITKSITKNAPLVPAGLAPEDTTLIQIMRNADGSGGSMPKSPVCSFDANDFQRIKAWIKAGALNDGVDDAGTDAASDADTGDAGDAGPG